ncbi:topoisomerase C-terminal repeat-containing protein [Clostridium sp. CF011]|uniref:type IA DNA topoisomerase n=1 Tax=Clostridium sp. CF011 TaxID=2843318 RepID=UPI001C0ACE22|nr:type IA DNA topoisomerase [Clostridium sp. CF011]MBU3093850.1 topoisomerase C-terminal repeat-containing protein [Clostridium sp. CF011]WAG71705.1 topoisomerase C-terminal repeat-containing protein [Clostridium sp. CF011]
MAKLIIAEKPSLAMNIVKSIGNMKKNDGYFENAEYIVTFAFGHLLKLYDVDDYFDRAKTYWNLEEIPFVPENFKFKLTDDIGIKKQYKIIKSLVKSPNVDEIINCGDADREGEVIVNNIIYKIFNEEKIEKKIKRLWLPEQTEQTILKELKELKELKDIELTKNLYNEGLARTYIDWLYGINLTRYTTLKAGSLFPVGRVLIPVVRFVYDRDKLIENFKPETFYEIAALIKKENLKIKAKLKDRKFSSDESEKATSLLNILKNKKALVSKVEKKEIKKQPKKLFSLDTLQNKLFKEEKISLNDTLKNLQALYEKGYVSYPRTNSEYLAENEKDKVKTIIEIIREKFNVNIRLKESTKIFDSSKIEGHSAVIPTLRVPNESTLSENELKVYNTVKNRLISNFLSEETIIEETCVLIKIENETIELKGNVIVKEGFLKYENDMDNKNTLPEFIEGEELNCVFAVDKKETQKPKKVTEADLNSFLKHPFKKQEINELENINDDDEYKDILSGVEIGTVATRANIIENAKRFDYIKINKNSLICDLKGIKLIEILDKLNINMSKEKTVEVGKELKQIYKNEKKIEDVVCKVKNELFEVINKSSNVVIEKINTKNIICKCPICGGDIVENAKAYGCNQWKEGCKLTIWKTIAGKKLTEKQAIQLIEKGKTSKIKGFKSKAGKKFDASLKLEITQVKFDFNN